MRKDKKKRREHRRDKRNKIRSNYGETQKGQTGGNLRGELSEEAIWGPPSRMPTTSPATAPVILCGRACPEHPCAPSSPAKQDGGGNVRKPPPPPRSPLSRGHRHQPRRQPLPAFLALGCSAPASHQPKSVTSEHGTHPPRRSPSLRVRSRYSPHSRTSLSPGVAHVSGARSGRSAKHTLLTWNLSKRPKRQLPPRSRETGKGAAREDS